VSVRGGAGRAGEERGDKSGRSSGAHRERDAEPRRLSNIINPALERMATSEQARAYGAWARAAGNQVASGAHPRYFSRGVLTVECTSSVWANELTYLGGQIIARMDEVAPGHPVKRFRFVVARAAATQEDEPAAPKRDSRYEQPAPADLDGARVQAEGVRDQRLRAAIEAALRGSSGEPFEASDDSPQSG
jgi:hypothetical protein